MSKRGTSKASADQRKALFLDAYIRNGENGTQAAIEVGISAKSAHVTASRWLKKAKVQKILESKRAEQRRKSGLTTDRVIQQLASVACFDPRRMVGQDRKPLALHLLDESTAAGVHLEMDGNSNLLKVKTVKPSEKNAALRMAIDILRLKDRPPPPPPDETSATIADPRETAKRMAFLLASGAHAEEKSSVKPAPTRRKKIPAAA